MTSRMTTAQMIVAVVPMGALFAMAVGLAVAVARRDPGQAPPAPDATRETDR
jgi:hypothetical protein